MVRFLFILLLILGGSLAVALYLDHRGKRAAGLARLRSAFLHGAPLGGYATPTEMREVLAGGWLRFRVPKRWREETGPGGQQLVFQVGGPASPTLRVRVSTLDGPQPVDAAAVQGVLRGLRPGPESVVQELPGGPVLLKCLEAAGGERVAYEWHLGQPLTPHQVLLAQFDLTVPLAVAGELTVQSDVSLLDREVRAAVFGVTGS